MIKRKLTSFIYTVLSVLLFCIYIYYPHAFFERNWASFQALLSPMLLQMVFFTAFQICVTGLNLLFYTILYKLELPFFERMKIDQRDWPWNENPELWKTQRNRLAYTLFRNLFIILPCYGIFLILTTNCAITYAQFPSL